MGGALAANDAQDGRLTPLDQTYVYCQLLPSSMPKGFVYRLERLGMGRYQFRLLVLCGCGWLADNMWLQTIAVILPRVQEHWQVSDKWIGMLSSSIFAGMTIGAWSWGSFSDYWGRMPAFNGTLLLTAIFGLLAGWAPSFGSLCVCMFGLGAGVGGSMPTDGTLFLESIPKNKHYLLTALSFFFSVGSVITAIIGLIVLPSRSCPPEPATCDPETQNTGWRIQLRILGALTLCMFIARVVLFRLQESAKWLVSVGRNEEALVSLQHIAEFNSNGDMQFQLSDVEDKSRLSIDQRLNVYSSLPVDESAPLSPDLHSTKPVPRPPTKSTLMDAVYVYLDRIAILFKRDMRRITILAWAIWAIVSAAYTIFNAFLPVWLEHKLETPTTTSHEASMRDYVIYTLAGCPGSLIGAWLVGTRLGYRMSMALSTIATALGVLVFMELSSSVAVVLSSMWVSLMGTLMYAVIYGWTPAAFPVALRGSACGIAAMLSRVTGVCAPLATGYLLALSANLPLLTSAVFFVLAAACMIALPV